MDEKPHSHSTVPQCMRSLNQKLRMSHSFNVKSQDPILYAFWINSQVRGHAQIATVIKVGDVLGV